MRFPRRSFPASTDKPVNCNRNTKCTARCWMTRTRQIDNNRAQQTPSAIMEAIPQHGACSDVDENLMASMTTQQYRPQPNDFDDNRRQPDVSLQYLRPPHSQICTMSAAISRWIPTITVPFSNVSGLRASSPALQNANEITSATNVVFVHTIRLLTSQCWTRFLQLSPTVATRRGTYCTRHLNDYPKTLERPHGHLI